MPDPLFRAPDLHGDSLQREARETPLNGAAATEFPSGEDHERRWLELAQAIAAERGNVTDDPALLKPAASPGQLVVIGSGIETVGFAASDEILLREADKVFYCVADPVTVVWIKRLRPDAYDLYVLYDDRKLRYLTYMQMTEAMLYFVRRGMKVVVVFYGHPGIFVLSTHRAIRIARREGHRAVMRAAVSALDTLCADLGVDPSQPGMQTFEATAMLVRLRRPDPSLHLVLWQVGLVGDMGFRRAGFLNRGFPILLDFLEETYGPGHEVVHYIGSRYPGIEPRIDRHTIATLRDPEVQAEVSGISTFYLPPKITIPADPDMVEKLELGRPGRELPQASSSPGGRPIDRYGPRELKAFEDFARFGVPAGYHWQEDTAAARFVLALREDGNLRDLYARNPAAAVARWPGLSGRDRTLLARRDAGAMQIAAKGVQLRFDGDARRLMRDLLENKSQNRKGRACPVDLEPRLSCGLGHHSRPARNGAASPPRAVDRIVSGGEGNEPFSLWPHGWRRGGQGFPQWPPRHQAALRTRRRAMERGRRERHERPPSGGPDAVRGSSPGRHDLGGGRESGFERSHPGDGASPARGGACHCVGRHVSRRDRRGAGR
jgi:hypothetical protein